MHSMKLFKSTFPTLNFVLFRYVIFPPRFPRFPARCFSETKTHERHYTGSWRRIRQRKQKLSWWLDCAISFAAWETIPRNVVVCACGITWRPYVQLTKGNPISFTSHYTWTINAYEANLIRLLRGCASTFGCSTC